MCVCVCGGGVACESRGGGGGGGGGGCVYVRILEHIDILTNHSSIQHAMYHTALYIASTVPAIQSSNFSASRVEK